MIEDITKHLKLKDHEVIEFIRIKYIDPYNVEAIYKYKNKYYKWIHNGKKGWWEELEYQLQSNL